MKKKEIGNLVLEGIPKIPTQLSEKLSRYQNTREALLVDWLKDGSGLLITTRFAESLQFHIVNEAGGRRAQLTFFDEPVVFGKMRPAISRKNGFLFLKDIGGNEFFQIYYFDLDTGQYEMLTDGQAKNGNIFWNREGSHFVFTSTKRNAEDNDIYLKSIDEREEEQLLFEANGYWYPLDWSPDSRWLLICHYLSAHQSHLYLLGVPDGQLIPLTEADKEISYRNGIWDIHSTGFFFTSDKDSQFRKLYHYKLEDKSISLITLELDWDIEDLFLSPDGQHLAFTANESGFSKLYLLNTSDFSYRPITIELHGQIINLKWHPSEKKIALTLNTAQRPSDVYVVDCVSGKLTQWTYSEIGGLDPATFQAPTLISYDTFDQQEEKVRKIPAFYFKPASFTKPLPVLVYIHGGPESQYRPIFSPIFQYYLNELGIAVIAPNVRGSTGYGKSFLQLDNGYKREDSVHDIGMLLNWIKECPELDASRVAVMGGSYGGYMVLASMTHYNEKLKCGIDIVGISNFVTFLRNTKSYRRELRRMEYGDERDPDMRKHLERISPTTNAHKITKPILIVQGLNDPRVPVSEAEQMLQAIRRNGTEAWYLLAKDEGHGFRKKSNRDYYTKAVILFLQRYLLEEEKE